MTTKIIIDLDSIDQKVINSIYTYFDLKEKIQGTEERLKSLKNELNLLMSNNFKFVDEKEENKHPLPSSFLCITSLKDLTTWIKNNREDCGIESADSEELREIMKRMYAAYSPSGIAHVIRCNFKDQEFLISDMILTINKIYNIITAYEQYANEYDQFVEFFFSNIYGILEAVEKTSKAVGKK